MTTEAPVRPTPKAGMWQAIIPLSVGRPSGTEKIADLIYPGEAVALTEAEAAAFLNQRRYPTPPIRPADQSGDPLPRITARTVFGARGIPVPPAPDPDATLALDVTDNTRVIEIPAASPGMPPEGVPLDIADPDAGRDGQPVRQAPRRGRPPASA